MNKSKTFWQAFKTWLFPWEYNRDRSRRTHKVTGQVQVAATNFDPWGPTTDYIDIEQYDEKIHGL